MRLALLHLAATSLTVGADLILHNGNIITTDRAFSTKQAVAITAGRIEATGSNADILKLKAAATRVIDLKGRTVVPGLIDSHVHAYSAGLSEFRNKIPPLDSFAAVQDFLHTNSAKIGKDEWIVVPRTFPTRLREMKMPTRDVLDAVPNPVAFDASYTWVANSAALKRSGVTRDTANPIGGEIVHDEHGEPNGILRNANSVLRGLRETAAFTPEEKLTAVERMLQRYLDTGITSVNDRAVNDEEIAVYQQLHSAKRLPLRVVMTWRLAANGPAEAIVRRIREAPYTPNAGDDWLRFRTFKVTLDGGMTIGTAYQRHDYSDFGKQLFGLPRSDRGQLFIDAAKLETILRAARDKGWQLTAHSQGGGAIDALLDAFEKLGNIAPTRSHLMHASFHTPGSIARTAKLGVAADVQAAWLHLDGDALAKVMPDDMRHFFPLRSYIAAGIPIAGGTDHMIGFDRDKAVNPYNPFLGMWIAITRKTKSGAVITPEERITRAEALRMYTTWGAWMQFAEKDKGSIEAGKFADLVVIDRDYLTCPEDAIRAIRPEMTILDGKIVFGK